MSKNTLSYYALLDVDKGPGVAKKIYSSVKSAEELGYLADSKIFMPADKLSYLLSMLREQSNIIYIRSHGPTAFLQFFILLIKRLQGKTIIVDIPTPKVIALKEINTLNASSFTKALSKLILIGSGSWVLFPAHRVVQYADEGCWFSFGVRHKTIKIGNGIRINSDIPLVVPTEKNDYFNLIAVAQLADWHGYDRLIRAIALLKEKHKNFNVSLKIVGDGDALSELKALTNKLHLEHCINFTGILYGNDLDSAFESAHIAVSSLGLHRKGLDEASDLKTREYMARGLCVIGTGKDPDFPSDSPYRFLVSNSNEIDELAALIYKLKKVVLPSPEVVRTYAQSTLSLTSKIEQILNF